MRKSIYVGGKMRGIPYYNTPAFHAAEEMLQDRFKVISPARMDLENGFDAMLLPPDTDWDELPPGFDLMDAIKRDTDAVLRCDAIFMLAGWEDSEGARAEHQLAKWAGKELLYQREPIYRTVLQHATRAIVEVMYRGLDKHEKDSWLAEPRDNHLDKGVRHALTFRLQADGNSPMDGEDHLKLALCRIAMTYAQKEEKDVRD